jgi:hypothetical protein
VARNARLNVLKARLTLTVLLAPRGVPADWVRFHLPFDFS